MKKLSTILSSLLMLTLFAACKSHEVQVSTPAFHNYTTECLGMDMDGRQTLRVWATGRNRTDGVEQAKKKAVYEVVFNGISGGSGQCNTYPLIDEPNARKKYEEYFNRFFTDGGAYKKYVSTTGQWKRTMQIFEGDGTLTCGLIVIVDRAALNARFTDDNLK